jgi:hypothetical protein
MLTELNRDIAPAPAQETRPQPEPVMAESQPAAAADDVREETPSPAPMVARDQADTAMLLRELSSLGFGLDDDRPSAPAPSSPPPRPVPAQPSRDEAKRKRKGLFGRG